VHANGAGYVLSILIPVLCVCVLPYEALRWALIGAATLTSGLFLLLNFRGPDFDAAGAKCACSRLPRSVHARSDVNAHSCPPCTRQKNVQPVAGIPLLVCTCQREARSGGRLIRDSVLHVRHSGQRSQPRPLNARGLRLRAAAASFRCEGRHATQGNSSS